MIWYPSEALWTSLILNSIGNSFFHSLQRSRALNFIVDRFQTNNTLIYSHGLSYNVAWYKHLFWFKVQFLSIALISCSVTCSYLTRLMSNINNRNKLQLMQIIWNVMLYLQHFTFALETTSLLITKRKENWTFWGSPFSIIILLVYAIVRWPDQRPSTQNSKIQTFYRIFFASGKNISCTQ